MADERKLNGSPSVNKDYYYYYYYYLIHLIYAVFFPYRSQMNTVSTSYKYT